MSSTQIRVVDPCPPTEMMGDFNLTLSDNQYNVEVGCNTRQVRFYTNMRDTVVSALALRLWAVQLNAAADWLEKEKP